MAREATRVTLTKSMSHLMRKKTFKQISISDICELSHISRRTFYRYYPDKYALLSDTYTNLFFSKLVIDPNGNFWSTFKLIVEQIYKENVFFRHAFHVTEQNGFWEETCKLLFPYCKREFPSTKETDRMCDFFIRDDIYVIFQLIVDWISNNPTCTPDEFANDVRIAFATRGKWTYELAMAYPLTPSGQITFD